jgi:predicted nucleotidyltransferase
MNQSINELLTRQEIRAVNAFVRALQDHYADRVCDVILYGSKARGDSQSDSDIDILILVDEDDWRLSHAISRLAARVSLHYDVLLAPLAMSQKRWPRSILYRTISAEGIPLAPLGITRSFSTQTLESATS